MTRHSALSLLAVLLLCLPAAAAQKAKAVARLASREGKPLGSAEFAAWAAGC